MTSEAANQYDSLITFKKESMYFINSNEWEKALIFLEENTHFKTLSLWLTHQLARQTCIATIELLSNIRIWLSQSEDKLRWEIFEQSKSLGFNTPAGMLGLSIFWSQGSMSPEGFEPICPDPTASKGILHCVLLMLATSDIHGPEEGARNLITQWVDWESQRV